ncbi:MAG: coproporphyrinogen III oxidase [Alphaproteobacteria bacterium]|nr:coproporphyrinogen III oxidase [Alphaproteobacteria bacterium]
MTEKEEKNSFGERARARFFGDADRLCGAFESADGTARFGYREWRRSEGGGGGRAALLLGGEVIEKAAVNFSAVRGCFSEEFASRIPGAGGDGRFFATGVSVIVHPRSPWIPTMHMNVRFLETTRWWFGGGADITPMRPRGEWGSMSSVDYFRGALRGLCETHDGAGDWPRFSEWCDRYFWLSHRGETRGAGGIFFDVMGVDEGSEVVISSWEEGFSFACGLVDVFIDCIGEILRGGGEWSEEERAEQLRRRGRYVEFNLLHDRGTRFGLETGGDVDAILSSLPPLASWDSN